MSQDSGMQSRAKGTLPIQTHMAMLESSQEKTASADCEMGPQVAQMRVCIKATSEKSSSRYQRRV